MIMETSEPKLGSSPNPLKPTLLSNHQNLSVSHSDNLLSPNIPDSPNFYSPKFLETQDFSFQNPPSPKFCGRLLSPKSFAPSIFQSSNPPYQKLSNQSPPSPRSSRSPSSKGSSPNPNSPSINSSQGAQPQKFFPNKLSLSAKLSLPLFVDQSQPPSKLPATRSVSSRGSTASNWSSDTTMTYLSVPEEYHNPTPVDMSAFLSSTPHLSALLLSRKGQGK